MPLQAHSFHHNVVPHYGSHHEVILGGHSWLISLLILGHMVAVMAFWTWLFIKQGASGKKRRRLRKAPEMHVNYAYTDGPSEKDCLA